MSSKKKLRVAVLYGGKSGEHEVSLLSAASIIEYLDRERFDVVPVGIDKLGRWFLNDLKKVYLADEKRLLLKTEQSTQTTLPAVANGHMKSHVGDNRFDVVFPALHGPSGEDGIVQGALELAGLPYVGAGVLSSAMSMDKDIAKRLMRERELRIPNYLVLRDTLNQQERAAFYKTIEKELGFPVFVKPARLGSSVGTHKVKSLEELPGCIADAFLYDNKLIVEQAVEGREIELSVLENRDYGAEPLVSLPGEIRVKGQYEFYSYSAKYLDPDAVDLIAPVALEEHQIAEAQALAQLAFTTLECEGMARVDLFLDKHTGQFFFNEINTIPGFTAMSMYPKLWEASGLAYKDLLTALIDLAIARHERKQNLVHDYSG